MKHLKSIQLLLLTILSLVILSCSNNKKEDPTPDSEKEYTGPRGPLMLHLHNYVGINEVQYYGIPTDDEENDRKITLDTAQFFLSNFELVREKDGTIYKVKDTIFILKVEKYDTYSIPNVPVGNYNAIKFSVGLNPTLSKMVPGNSKDLLNTPGMSFGTPAQEKGYAYLNMSGKVAKISDLANGTGAMQDFQYKIGTDSNYVKVEMDGKFSVDEDGGGMVHLKADISELFYDVLETDKNNLSIKTLEDNDSALAKKIAGNIKRMFKYE